MLAIGSLKQNVCTLMPSGTYMTRVKSRQVQMMQKFYQCLMTQYLILIAYYIKKILKLKKFFSGH